MQGVTVHSLPIPHLRRNNIHKIEEIQIMQIIQMDHPTIVRPKFKFVSGYALSYPPITKLAIYRPHKKKQK